MSKQVADIRAVPLECVRDLFGALLVHLRLVVIRETDGYGSGERWSLGTVEEGEAINAEWRNEIARWAEADKKPTRRTR
jgi:hypothetical protein